MLFTDAAPIMKSFAFVVVNVTDAVVAFPFAEAAAPALRFGSNGLAVFIPLIPNAINSNGLDALKVAVIDAEDKELDAIA